MTSKSQENESNKKRKRNMETLLKLIEKVIKNVIYAKYYRYLHESKALFIILCSRF